MIKKLIVLSLLLIAGNHAFPQSVEMADGLRSSGKIYVIVLIIVIVLGGLIAYLFAMDKKLTRMEKLLNEREQTKRSSKSFGG